MPAAISRFARLFHKAPADVPRQSSVDGTRPRRSLSGHAPVPKSIPLALRALHVVSLPFMFNRSKAGAAALRARREVDGMLSTLCTEPRKAARMMENLRREYPRAIGYHWGNHAAMLRLLVREELSPPKRSLEDLRALAGALDAGNLAGWESEDAQSDLRQLKTITRSLLTHAVYDEARASGRDPAAALCKQGGSLGEIDIQLYLRARELDIPERRSEAGNLLTCASPQALHAVLDPDVQHPAREIALEVLAQRLTNANAEALRELRDGNVESFNAAMEEAAALRGNGRFMQEVERVLEAKVPPAREVSQPQPAPITPPPAELAANPRPVRDGNMAADFYLAAAHYERDKDALDPQERDAMHAQITAYLKLLPAAELDAMCNEKASHPAREIALEVRAARANAPVMPAVQAPAGPADPVAMPAAQVASPAAADPQVPGQAQRDAANDLVQPALPEQHAVAAQPAAAAAAAAVLPPAIPQPDRPIPPAAAAALHAAAKPQIDPQRQDVLMLGTWLKNLSTLGLKADAKPSEKQKKSVKNIDFLLRKELPALGRFQRKENKVEAGQILSTALRARLTARQREALAVQLDILADAKRVAGVDVRSDPLWALIRDTLDSM